MTPTWTINGKLTVARAIDDHTLLGEPVAKAVAAFPPGDSAGVGVAAIDPDSADTAEFCARYDVPLSASANCVVIAGKRGDTVRYAACLALATTKVNVNTVVRRHLAVRKASFAPMDDAVRLTRMEYGGITPIGLPAAWPILVDAEVARQPELVIGSGLRASKLFVTGGLLAGLDDAEVVDGLAS